MASAHFTLYAQRLLAAGKIGDAISVLEEGIKQYPNYATAYALLVRAYLQISDFATAYEVTVNAYQRFSSHRGLQLLYNQLEQRIAEHTQPPSSPAAGVSGESHTLQEELLHQQTSSTPLIHEDGSANQDGTCNCDSLSANTTAHSDTRTTDNINDSSSSTLISESSLTETPLPEDHTEPLPLRQEDTPPTLDDELRTELTSAPVESDEVLSVTHSMRIVETATIDSRAMRMLRSSNIRLIPGLEFAPLRIESPRFITTSQPLEFPPFKPIRGSRRTHATHQRASVPSTPAELEAELQARQGNVTPTPAKTSLELLAERLERARIKPLEQREHNSETATTTDELTMVTETMAQIYERQGAIEQAIKAYTILARQHPERRSTYEEKIAHLRSMLR